MNISPGEERSNAAAWIKLQRLGKLENELHDYCLVGNVVHQVMFLQFTHQIPSNSKHIMSKT